MAIHWKADYATHDRRIDEQHQQIFRFANRLEALARNEEVDTQEVDSLLRFLESYAQSHFRYEEACMLKRQCPVAQRNRSEHLAFKASLARSLAAYRNDGYTQKWARELSERIQKWLNTHICLVDIQLRDYPAESGTAREEKKPARGKRSR